MLYLILYFSQANSNHILNLLRQILRSRSDILMLPGIQNTDFMHYIFYIYVYAYIHMYCMYASCILYKVTCLVYASNILYIVICSSYMLCF